MPLRPCEATGRTAESADPIHLVLMLRKMGSDHLDRDRQVSTCSACERRDLYGVVLVNIQFMHGPDCGVMPASNQTNRVVVCWKLDLVDVSIVLECLVQVDHVSRLSFLFIETMVLDHRIGHVVFKASEWIPVPC